MPIVIIIKNIIKPIEPYIENLEKILKNDDCDVKDGNGELIVPGIVNRIIKYININAHNKIVKNIE